MSATEPQEKGKGLVAKIYQFNSFLSDSFLSFQSSTQINGHRAMSGHFHFKIQIIKGKKSRHRFCFSFYSIIKQPRTITSEAQCQNEVLQKDLILSPMHIFSLKKKKTYNCSANRQKKVLKTDLIFNQLPMMGVNNKIICNFSNLELKPEIIFK